MADRLREARRVRASRWLPDDNQEEVRAVSEKNVNVWADAFGRWHASVPLTNSPETDARNARDLIVAELAQREGPNFDPSAVQVIREQVRNHGTVIYGEVESGGTIRTCTLCGAQVSDPCESTTTSENTATE